MLIAWHVPKKSMPITNLTVFRKSREISVRTGTGFYYENRRTHDCGASEVDIYLLMAVAAPRAFALSKNIDRFPAHNQSTVISGGQVPAPSFGDIRNTWGCCSADIACFRREFGTVFSRSDRRIWGPRGYQIFRIQALDAAMPFDYEAIQVRRYE